MAEPLPDDPQTAPRASTNLGTRGQSGDPMDCPLPWMGLWLAIAIAGGLYAAALVGIVSLIGLGLSWSTGFRGVPLANDLPVVMLLVSVGLFFAFSVGFVYTGIVAVVVLPIAEVVLWTMRARPSPTLAGSFVGGLVGFLCTWFLWFDLRLNGGGWNEIFVLVIGPGLATVVGQIGAAYAQWTRFHGLATAALEPKEPGRQPIQFDLRQLLVLTAWISILLGVLQLMGFLTPGGLAIFAGWFVYQAATLTIVLRCLLPWWERRHAH